MKKIICVLSVVAILFSLCACGNKEDASVDTNGTVSAASDTDKNKIKETNKTVKTITKDDFEKIAAKNSLETSIATYGSSSNIYWPDFKTATEAKNESISVLFFENNDKIQAQTNFDTAKKVAYGQTHNEYYKLDFESEETGKNYTIYTTKTSGAYYAAIIINSTVIVVMTRLTSSTSETMMNTVNSLLKDFGF
jgi:predicted small lipoprotein YifL